MPRIHPLTIVCKNCGSKFLTYRASTQLPRFCSRRCAKVRPADERFWAKVKKAGGDRCWEWTAARTDDGYGNFVFEHRRPAKPVRILAHRYSYQLANGCIPEGLEICHSCDNPSCVRPSHLFAGTHDDNMKDAASKARVHRKTRPGRKPVTPEVIEELRRLSSNNTKALAAIAVNLSESYISVLSAIHGIQWGRARIPRPKR